MHLAVVLHKAAVAAAAFVSAQILVEMTNQVAIEMVAVVATAHSATQPKVMATLVAARLPSVCNDRIKMGICKTGFLPVTADNPVPNPTPTAMLNRATRTVFPVMMVDVMARPSADVRLPNPNDNDFPEINPELPNPADRNAGPAGNNPAERRFGENNGNPPGQPGAEPDQNRGGNGGGNAGNLLNGDDEAENRFPPGGPRRRGAPNGNGPNIRRRNDPRQGNNGADGQGDGRFPQNQFRENQFGENRGREPGAAEDAGRRLGGRPGEPLPTVQPGEDNPWDRFDAETSPSGDEWTDDSLIEFPTSAGTGPVAKFVAIVLHTLAYAVLSIVVVLILWMVVRAIRDLKFPQRAQKTEEESSESAFEPAREVSPGAQPPDVYIAAARKMAADGRYREAIAQLMLGAMSRSERAGYVRHQSGLTVRDYLRSLRQQKREYRGFREMVRVFRTAEFRSSGTDRSGIPEIACRLRNRFRNRRELNGACGSTAGFCLKTL